MKEVLVIAGARSAIGDFGGALKDVPPCDLAATVIREALNRAGVNGDEVGHVAVGNVICTEPRDMYLSRVAAINAGISKQTPAFNVNRLCGSGLQVVVSAAQCILHRGCRGRRGCGRRKHEPGPLYCTGTALGRAHGRQCHGRHDDRSIVGPLWPYAHGRDGRECGGTFWRQPGRSGCPGRGVAPARQRGY